MSAPAPATARAASWTFSATHRSVPQTRHAIRAQPADGNLHHTRPSADLLVSELGANAVEHAPGLVRLSMSAAGGRPRSAWGSGPTGGGTAVWFALPVPAAPDA
ncbi:hypothetical protein ACQEVF_47955 [Nonomuraea polychroma]|uniref:hypothetical protein n=1 Tax=Nonomuraea polychroma TaxID=46176 RepID=UPI003D9457DE